MFWKFILIDPKKLQQCINIDNNCPAIKTFVSITTFFIIFMPIWTLVKDVKFMELSLFNFEFTFHICVKRDKL